MRPELLRVELEICVGPPRDLRVSGDPERVQRALELRADPLDPSEVVRDRSAPAEARLLLHARLEQLESALLLCRHRLPQRGELGRVDRRCPLLFGAQSAELGVALLDGALELTDPLGPYRHEGAEGVVLAIELVVLTAQLVERQTGLATLLLRGRQILLGRLELSGERTLSLLGPLERAPETVELRQLRARRALGVGRQPGR